MLGYFCDWIAPLSNLQAATCGEWDGSVHWGKVKPRAFVLV
jgi:hypothetical protein